MPQIPPILFGPSAGATEHEWLVPDGRGGYATGTASGLRTRPQHGLLAFAGHLALAALDLTVTLPSGAKVPLYTHRWATGTAPDGHLRLETFSLVDGLPQWRWRVGDVVVERQLAMRRGHPSLAVLHRVVSAPGPVGLAVAAMCTWRQLATARHAGGPAMKVEQVSGGVIIEDSYRLDGPGWQPGGEWHFGARTGARDEDLWCAGTYFQRVNAGTIVEISAWGGDLGTRPPTAAAVIAAAAARHRRIVGSAGGTDATLRLAADTFVIRDGGGPDVVSAYPDATGSLADTMAAYEGLFLATGRADDGRELLRARLRAARPEEPPQAALWLLHAIDRHVARTGDTDLAAELAVSAGRLLRRAVAARVDPTDDLIRVDTSTRVDKVDTSTRVGKPVDLNALWVNALAAMADLLAAIGRDDTEPRTWRDRAARSFAARFPAPEGWLHDVVEGPPAAYPLGAGTQHDDPTLRPHQLLAWSLPHAPLAANAAALRAIGPALLTPLGLRTLAPTEYGYRPTTGDGQVLPWLTGPWADACAAADLPITGLLTGIEAHLAEAGLGSVGAAAHGDPPHQGIGSPFSARSVAEILRVRERQT